MRTSIILLLVLVSQAFAGRLIDHMGGERQLKEFFPETHNITTSDGSWLFFVIIGFGKTNAVEESKKMLYFLWEMNDGTYQFSKIDLLKVRFRFVESIDNPHIEFSGDLYAYDSYFVVVQEAIDKFVKSVIITCTDEQYKKMRLIE